MTVIFSIYPLSMLRFRFLPIAFASFLLLSACVDTTGLSAQSSRTPKGNASASVIVVEYADLQCPACKSAHETITKTLLEKYGSKIRFEFRHFPLRSIHQHAFEAAQAAECAADQGKFWEFVDVDYQRQSDLSSSALRDWAKALSLDSDLFDRCVRSGIKEDTILDDYAQGEKLGVRGTPTFFVNNTHVSPNTLEAISAAIDAALKGGGTQMPL